MKKQIVLAALLAVSMSAVRAENKTTFQKVKDVAGDVITHPATKITAGVVLVGAAAINIFKFHPAHKGLFTDKLKLENVDTGFFVSYKNLNTKEKVQAVCDRGLEVIGIEVPVATALLAGLGLIGSGIYDAVKRIQGKEEKKA